MNLQLEEQLKLTEIVTKSGGDIQKAVLAAYEEGLLKGARGVVGRLAQGLQQPAAGQGSGDDDEDDNGPTTPLTPSDKAWFRAQGIDPDKKYRYKNSMLTIVAYKPSRWKYPVSITNQNGRRLKCSISFLKQCKVG
jgi:hypothetical protein